MNIMKEDLEKLISEGKTNSEIAEIYNVHRTTVSKWLKSFDIVKQKTKNQNCVLCDKFLDDNPRNRKCCASCTTRLRRYRLKKQAVEYKGGVCEKCGYNKSLAALEFHHIDPNEKDFAIANMNHKSWSFIKKELDKCVMLCSNCHREEHTKYDDEKLKKMVE